MNESILSDSCVPRRIWGKSGLSVPVIPFGTQGFGNNFGPVTDDEAMSLIRRAVDLGVNHFDCARCYGDSLRKLGLAIKQGVVERDEIIISGRLCCHSGAEWGGYGEGRADYSSLRAQADVGSQLDILGTTYFDAMLIHDPGEIEPTLEEGGVLEGLKQCRDEGSIRNVGYGMKPPEFHLAAIERGEIDVLLTFDRFNLFGQNSAEDIIPAAHGKGIGVMNGWVIKRGWLTGMPVETFVPRDKWSPGGEQERAENMRLWCEERGISLLALALQYCLRDERVQAHPLGSLNVAQLEANVSAVLTRLDESVFTEFDKAGL